MPIYLDQCCLGTVNLLMANSAAAVVLPVALPGLPLLLRRNHSPYYFVVYVFSRYGSNLGAQCLEGWS